jgi:hypothetical protein
MLLSRKERKTPVITSLTKVKAAVFCEEVGHSLLIAVS